MNVTGFINSVELTLPEEKQYRLGKNILSRGKVSHSFNSFFVINYIILIKIFTYCKQLE